MKDNMQIESASHLTLSWRIGLPHWETDAAFGRLMGLLQEHRSVVDEVALFETITHHLYIPLDVYARRMELAAQRLDACRQAGIPSAGINVLCTIGHINEAWSYMPPLPFQAMVGHDGGVSTGCACPNTPAMRAYVRAKYRLVAAARPDFIWVDDDIRMHHHGVAWGCFCSTCLGLFAERAGRPYAREELVKAFDDPAAGRLREMWIEQNIASLESLLADVAATIHLVDPEIVIGKMSCGPGTTYSGQAFERWFTALRATKARPGGGFYSDEAPIGMYHKAIECGWQRAALPPTITDVQYELENFPYQRLKKSATALVDECTLALAFGLNGVAFNMLALDYADRGIYLTQVATRRSGLAMQGYPQTLAEFESWFATEEACRDYLVALRWPDGFHCPRCGSGDAWPVRKVLMECRACGHQASVTAGTIFQDTHKPLRTWFRAAWYVTAPKTGVSAVGIQNILGLGSYKTAWSWLHKLRRAMVRPGRDRLAGAVEVDETYIGSEPGKQGRELGSKQLVVIAAQEDGSKIGRIRMTRLPKATAEHLHAFIEATIEPGSAVRTDKWSGYSGLAQKGYQHVAKAQGRLDVSDAGEDLLPRVHRVASLLKRWLIGTHHGAISDYHLDYYLDEFTFRFNRRTSKRRGKLFYRLLQQAVQVEPAPYKLLIQPELRGVQ